MMERTRCFRPCGGTGLRHGGSQRVHVALALPQRFHRFSGGSCGGQRNGDSEACACNVIQQYACVMDHR